MPQSKNVLKRIRPKRASKVDLKLPIDRYIKRVYGDNVASEAEESLDELQELRNQIVAASAHSNTCETRLSAPTFVHHAACCWLRLNHSILASSR